MFDRVNQYGVDTQARGNAGISSLTMPFTGQEDASVHETFASEADSLDAEAHPATGGSPVTFVLILIGLIVALFIVQRSSPILGRETFGVNWLSFAQVTVMAAAGILLLKAFFGRFPVRGITPAVAAI